MVENFQGPWPSRKFFLVCHRHFFSINFVPSAQGKPTSHRLLLRHSKQWKNKTDTDFNKNREEKSNRKYYKKVQQEGNITGRK